MILKLEQAIDENDPQAEWLVELVCAACQQHWEERLDIASFLWTQVTARARRVLIAMCTAWRARTAGVKPTSWR